MSDFSSHVDQPLRRMTFSTPLSPTPATQLSPTPNVMPASPHSSTGCPSPGPAPIGFVPRPIPSTEAPANLAPHPVPNPHFTTPIIALPSPAANDGNVSDIAASGRIGDPCPSYTWWRSLLARNAHVQGLDARRASSLTDYVINELLTSDAFLTTLEDTFSNHTEEEDAQ
ncbi:hypothetical protein PTTG_28139 [Puccinia triticina 1-1 BBBD Race 1]|uniref:Uncharacterized protein n=1 Tax=Puccinia triticina (isolate 1-1 / race 1 (BBBD)) TaxID=630390 RepID=A0A180GE60_PUCT1|nr:hypothetical protein PTTG_28139 [Puccinia triticina 1-1 BBBD Race 1]